jgi:hypothetical protein
MYSGKLSASSGSCSVCAVHGSRKISTSSLRVADL